MILEILVFAPARQTVLTSAANAKREMILCQLAGGLVGASYIHNHTLTHTNTFSQTHICSQAFGTLVHSLKHRG